MHIVQVLVSLNLGGSELVAVELSEHAARRGHRVTVIAADGPLGERVRAAGASQLDWTIGRKQPGTLRYVSRLRRWLKRERPDVVHVHSRLPAWICHLAIRKINTSQRPAWITTVHGRYSVSPYSAIMVRGDRVICVSDYIREYAQAHYPDVKANAIEVVHGGVSRQAFPYGHRPADSWFRQIRQEYPELQGRRLICLPGRLSRYKGHAHFLKMIAGLCERFKDVHGVVVGKVRPGSRYFAALNKLARDLGVENRITFVGARPDMREWMAASEIVYSLSADPPEAFGRTVPEALFLGVPVIAWDHGGVRETMASLFPQGAVPPGDFDALLLRSSTFLSQRPEVQPANAFDLQDSMEATLQIYGSLARMPSVPDGRVTRNEQQIREPGK